jgi:hypothetical protein
METVPSWNAAYADQLATLEVVSVGVFSLDYLIRFVVRGRAPRAVGPHLEDLAPHISNLTPQTSHLGVSHIFSHETQFVRRDAWRLTPQTSRRLASHTSNLTTLGVSHLKPHDAWRLAPQTSHLAWRVPGCGLRGDWMSSGWGLWVFVCALVISRDALVMAAMACAGS